MLNSDEQFLVNFVQDLAESQPITARAKIYRGLADLMPKGEFVIANNLKHRAVVLELAQSRCAKLKLKFDKQP